MFNYILRNIFFLSSSISQKEVIPSRMPGKDEIIRQNSLDIMCEMQPAFTIIEQGFLPVHGWIEDLNMQFCKWLYYGRFLK